MRRIRPINSGFAVAAWLVCSAVAASPSSATAQRFRRGTPDDRGVVRLTERDVDASNEEAAAAYRDLIGMWTTELHRVGVRFVPPQLVRYRGAMRTRCGIVAPSNASYCFNSNTIYFDDVFLAAQGKLAGEALGTDGDMVSVGIIAHEMGHAVAMQLGHVSRDSYENESIADCLAGAFARHADAAGELQKGDIDEAFFGMAAAADPTFDSTGDPRIDARMNARLARAAHGTREQRIGNFRAGLEGGGAACLEELR